MHDSAIIVIGLLYRDETVCNCFWYAYNFNRTVVWLSADDLRGGKVYAFDNSLKMVSGVLETNGNQLVPTIVQGKLFEWSSVLLDVYHFYLHHH